MQDSHNFFFSCFRSLTRKPETDRGQGLQNAITDVDNYITALGQLRANAGSRQEVMTAYDDEVVERGSEAVKQSLSEADKSLDIETVKQMLMMTKGHGK